MALQSQLFRGDSKLEAAAFSDPAHLLQGASGPHVAKIQQALIQLDRAAVAPDGIFGPGTAAAVGVFKQKRQILNTQGRIDTIVGKKTMAALDAEMLAKERGGGGSRGQLGIVGGTRTHTLVYFSGDVDGAGNGGKFLIGPPGAVGAANGQVVLTDMENLPTGNAGKTVFGFGGSIDDRRSGPDLALLLIQGVNDPRGKLIIYGFSAGGANSLDLCRALNRVGKKVDLLVTVDVAVGLLTPLLDRSVPPNVLLNRNYFQTFPSSRNSFGAPATPTGEPRIQNVPCNDRFTSRLKFNNHGGMQDVTRADANNDMRILLGSA